MEIKSICGLLLCLISLCFSVGSVQSSSEEERELSFLEKLRAKEEQEYLAKRSEIMTMSEAEYKTLLEKRMADSFADREGPQKLAVVVNVSEEMNASLLGRVFGGIPEQKMMGIEVLSDNHNLINATDLKFIRAESDSESGAYYQKVEGLFTQEACQQLLSNPKVADVVAVNDSDSSINMEIFFMPKGRILPPPQAKSYDDSFINEGYYQEIMSRLGSRETVAVAIGFRRTVNDSDAYALENETLGIQEIDKFLEDLEPLNISVRHKMMHAVFGIVDRQAAKAIYEDPRVNYIRLAKESEGVFFRE